MIRRLCKQYGNCERLEKGVSPTRKLKTRGLRGYKIGDVKKETAGAHAQALLVAVTTSCFNLAGPSVPNLVRKIGPERYQPTKGHIDDKIGGNERNPPSRSTINTRVV